MFIPTPAVCKTMIISMKQYVSTYTLNFNDLVVFKISDRTVSDAVDRL